MSAIKGPNDGDCAADDQIFRHECILTLDSPGMHVIEVTPRVATVYSVVSHHEEVPAGHDNIELDSRRLNLCAIGANRKIGSLIQSVPVDSEPIRFVATDDVIARQADYPLDQVFGAGIGQYANKLKHLADRSAFAGSAADEPSAWIRKDNDLPAFDAAEFLHNNAIVNLQSVLHRDRWDQKHLADEASYKRGNNDRADDDGRQFLEEGQDVLTEAQMLRVGRSSRLGPINVGFRYRLQGAPWRRLSPPACHIGYR